MKKAYNRFLTHRHTLTVEQQVLLLKMYTRHKVKNALLSINANKSLCWGKRREQTKGL